jgi:RNA polymerase sigma-70 factor (ECF subfamily)
MNNQQLIENFYCDHKDELIVFVTTRINDVCDAEDMVQELFLRLLSGQQIICEATLPALAYTMCRHMIVDWYRRHAFRDDMEHELKAVAPKAGSAESVLSMREITEQLERGLARLPKECQDIYRLHIYGGLQAKDICQQTGQKYKTVEYRLGVARKEIRNFLRFATAI